MDDLAATGLRTLLFARRNLTEEDLAGLIERDPEDFESDLTLLGTTGLEDVLQDEVKDCIRQFKEARIKVWMLTGDKGETAQNIGQSCGIIDLAKQEVYDISSMKLDVIQKDIKTAIESIQQLQVATRRELTTNGSPQKIFTEAPIN